MPGQSREQQMVPSPARRLATVSRRTYSTFLLESCSSSMSTGWSARIVKGMVTKSIARTMLGTL